jgi:hypothetical protein
MATYTDFAIVCGLSRNGGFDGAKETDWYKYGIPTRQNDIWELQFQCCHKTGDPNATVIGSFVLYDRTGKYIGTTTGPVTNLTDSTAWQRYAFQYQFVGDRYVFAAIWWHAATPLSKRYICGVQMAKVTQAGQDVTVVTPDIYLTLGVAAKTLGGPQSHLGPPKPTGAVG